MISHSTTHSGVSYKKWVSLVKTGKKPKSAIFRSLIAHKNSMLSLEQKIAISVHFRHLLNTVGLSHL